MSGRLEGVAWAATIVLAAGTVYEALVATEVIAIGDVPGEGARGSGVLLAASVVACLVGAGASFARATIARRPSSAVWALLPLTGAAYTFAHWLAFDPYYAPTLRRYSEGGITSTWIVVVLVAATVAAIVTAVAPRPGAAVAAVVLLLEALTVFVMPFGK